MAAAEEALAAAQIVLVAVGSGVAARKGLASADPAARAEALAAGRDAAPLHRYWMQCFNEHRAAPVGPETALLDLAALLARRSSPGAVRIRHALLEAARHPPLQSSSVSFGSHALPLQTQPSAASAEPFFVVCGNVDGVLERAGLSEEQVYNLYGTTDWWQCSAACTPDPWRMPRKFRFAEAPLHGPSPPASPGSRVVPFHSPPVLPPLQQPAATPDTPGGDDNDTGETGNDDNSIPLPRCQHCKARARPAIKLGADDPLWVGNDRGAARFWTWATTALKLGREMPVVILELETQPADDAVQFQAEMMLTNTFRYGGQLIRVGCKSAGPTAPSLAAAVIDVDESSEAFLRRVLPRLQRDT